VGRIAGITAEQTRKRLLSAAAAVFADRGYEGARVSQIARRAGLTTGAIYAHYATKAELLCEAIRSNVPDVLAGLADVRARRGDAGSSSGVAEVLQEIGESLARRSKRDGTLLMEAAVAARRDRTVARMLRDNVADKETTIAALVRAAQDAGEIDPNLPPDAVARMCMTLAMGSLVVRALGLHQVDEEEWAVVIRSLLDAARIRSESAGE
jgi:AcrR family transcriptional regulator